jgi:glycerol uptake facilitator-like aquaporin
LVAEFIGTLLLTTSVLGVVSAAQQGFSGLSGMAAPVIVGGTLAVLVYLLSPYSSAHLNPAVTFTQVLFRKMSAVPALLYIVAQLAGAFLATFLVRALLATPDLTFAFDIEQATPALLLSEFVGTAILLLGVQLLAFKRIPEAMSGLVAGGSLALGVAIAALAGPAFLNPAIAVASGSYHAVFTVIPFLGAVLGAGFGVLLGELRTIADAESRHE